MNGYRILNAELVTNEPSGGSSTTYKLVFTEPFTYVNKPMHIVVKVGESTQLLSVIRQRPAAGGLYWLYFIGPSGAGTTMRAASIREGDTETGTFN